MARLAWLALLLAGCDLTITGEQSAIGTPDAFVRGSLDGGSRPAVDAGDAVTSSGDASAPVERSDAALATDANIESRCDSIVYCRDVPEPCTITYTGRCADTRRGTFGCGSQEGLYFDDGTVFLCEGPASCEVASEGASRHCSNLEGDAEPPDGSNEVIIWSMRQNPEERFLGSLKTKRFHRASFTVDLGAGQCLASATSTWFPVGFTGTADIPLSEGDRECLRETMGCPGRFVASWGGCDDVDCVVVSPGSVSDPPRPACTTVQVQEALAKNQFEMRIRVEKLLHNELDATWEIYAPE